MFMRILLLAIATFGVWFAPATALAADPATVMPGVATTPNPAESALGPQSSNPAGGSNADGGALQPAGNSPLQSTANDATGLTAPNSNALQAPASANDALKVLAGEADGSPHYLNAEDSNSWGWLWFALGFGGLFAAGYLAYRYRRRIHVLLKHIRIPGL